jgi:hypothetical protein
MRALYAQVDYGPANETTYCEKLKTNLYRKKPHQCVHYHPQVGLPHCLQLTFAIYNFFLHTAKNCTVNFTGYIYCAQG